MLRAHPFSPTPPVVHWHLNASFFRTQVYPPPSQAQLNPARCSVDGAASWSRPLQALGRRLERQLPGSGQAEPQFWSRHPYITLSRYPNVGA